MSRQGKKQQFQVRLHYLALDFGKYELMGVEEFRLPLHAGLTTTMMCTWAAVDL